MANPNLVNVTSIFGKTVFEDNISSSDTEFLQNASSSNKLLKINSLIIANINGSASATITIQIRTGNGTGILSTLAHTVTVPADGAFVAISKDTPIYLEEDRAIYTDASASGNLSATCSYDEIDDA